MTKHPKKFKVSCRFKQEITLYLPCNWVKEGFCGINGKKCNIVILEGGY
jgi:hypothetical protein